MNKEAGKHYNYRTSFIRNVVLDLNKKGKSYVFNNSQLEDVKKLVKVKEYKRDECCIYIRRIV